MLRLLLCVLDAVAAFVFSGVEGGVRAGEQVGEGWGAGTAESGYSDAGGD